MNNIEQSYEEGRTRLTPEAGRGFACIERSLPYLESQGVFSRGETLAKIVDNFYDLGGSHVSIAAGRGAITRYYFGNVKFNENRIGTLPPAELTNLLEDFRGERFDFSKDDMKYETVREGFILESPSGEILRGGMQIGGLLVTTVGPMGAFLTLGKNSTTEDVIVSGVIGVASLIGGIYMMARASSSSLEKWEEKIREQGERKTSGRIAYDEIISAARDMDKLLKAYSEIKKFERNEAQNLER